MGQLEGGEKENDWYGRTLLSLEDAYCNHPKSYVGKSRHHTLVLQRLWNLATQSEVPGPTVGITWNLLELQNLNLASDLLSRICIFTGSSSDS